MKASKPFLAVVFGLTVVVPVLAAAPAQADWVVGIGNLQGSCVQFDWRGGTASFSGSGAGVFTVDVNNLFDNRIGGGSTADSWSIWVNDQKVVESNVIEQSQVGVSVAGDWTVTVQGVDVGFWAGWYGPQFCNPVFTADEVVPVEPPYVPAAIPTGDYRLDEGWGAAIAVPVGMVIDRVTAWYGDPNDGNFGADWSAQYTEQLHGLSVADLNSGNYFGDPVPGVYKVLIASVSFMPDPAYVAPVEPVASPEPVITPDPTPEPSVEPSVTPEPTPEPTVEPTPEPTVEPVVVSSSEVRPEEPPMQEVVPVPVVVEPVPVIRPEPVVVPEPQPVVEPEPVVVPEPVPAVEPEPVVVPEPVVEPTPDPEPVVEPVVDPIPVDPVPVVEEPPVPTPTPDPADPVVPVPVDDIVVPPTPVTPIVEPPVRQEPVVSSPVVVPQTPEVKPSDTTPQISLESAQEIRAAIQEANTILDSAEPGSAAYEEALNVLAEAAAADDPELPAVLADIPLAGAVLDTFNALGNVGADMSPKQRKKSKQVVIAAVIVGQIAAAASAVAANVSGYRRKN